MWPGAKLLRWGLVVLLAGGLLYGLLGRSTSRQAAVLLPDLVLETEGGQPKNLRALVGRPVVLNTWATWCAPCRREMPLLLEEAARQEGVQFVFVNMGEGPEAIRIFLDEVSSGASPICCWTSGPSFPKFCRCKACPPRYFSTRRASW